MRKGSKMTDEQRLKLSLSHIGQGLGRKVSEETKIKISLSQKGKTIPINTRLKISQSLKGRKMPYVATSNKLRTCSEETRKLRSEVAKRNWTNPIFRKKLLESVTGQNNSKWIIDRTAYQEKCRLRRTKEWKNWRLDVFNRDNYTCQECGIRGCRLEPHHIDPLRNNWDTRFDIKNGITLCRQCHKGTFWKESSFAEKYINIISNK